MATDKQFEAILEKVRAARNFDFRNYKRESLGRRIARRMADRRCRSYGDYLALLDRDPQEVDRVVSAMLIKVTSFFRDPEMWRELERKVIPGLLADKRAGEEVRIWSAGCATGEEAFSVAIMFAEALGPAFTNFEVKIFGTDVDEAAIAYARRGVYNAAQVEPVPREYLDKYFVRAAEGWAVRKEIRRNVVFGVNNLVSDAPISRLDLLLCRNVFIYLDTELQKRVLTRFFYALKSEGVLVLGKAELIPFASKIFEPVDLPWRLYRKDHRGPAPGVTTDRLLGLLEQENITRIVGQSRDELSLLEQFHRNVVEAVPQPLIGTSNDGTIILWNAAAAKLWGRVHGEAAGKKLTALNLPGLPGDLLLEKTAMVRDGRSEREVSDGRIAGRAKDEGTTHVEVSVTPIRNVGGERLGLLYQVFDVTSMRGTEEELRKTAEELRTAIEERATANEELQSTNEELQTTNEELQSANEELQTTNEELQSTNEELETTNQELHSTNQELDATNRELAARTEQMNVLAFYQRTIIRSLSAAVVVLDAHGRITAWNLAAERFLGLAENEALGQLLWTLRVPALAPSLLTRIRRALAARRGLRLEAVSYALPNGSEGHAIVAAVPLLEDGNNLGAVILFEDTTRAMNLASENARLRGNKKKRGER